MNTYRHAGDLGDILAGLPVIRYFGVGVLYIEAAPYTRQFLTPDKWCGLDILLKQQPYIVDVLPWENQRANITMNDFRANMGRALRKASIQRNYDDPAFRKSLVDWQLEAHGVPLTERDRAWLAVEPNPVAPVVINRTGPGRAPHHVYQNPNFPWHWVWQKYHDKAVFIGTPEEHRVFSATCGDLRYHPTKDLNEAARVIAGASLFIGNQSACFWIAAGLHKPHVLEVWPSGPNSCLFYPGAIHGWNVDVELPNL
jgi:hypothetical protein